MSRKERVVLFGGGGFIGSHLARELLDAGYPVRIFDRKNCNWSNFDGVMDRIEAFEGDFVNVVDVRAALDGCGAAIHLVSSTLPSTSNENPVYDMEANVVATLRFLDAVRSLKVGRMLFISSGGTVYGRARRLPISEDDPTDPLCSYGIGKLAIEKYVGLYRHLHGMNASVFRIANPYGERQNPAAAQGAVAVFLARARAGQPIRIWGDGEAVRDYIYIGDVARALRMALDTNTDGALYNVGTGTGTSLNALIAAMRSVTGLPLRVDYEPGRPLDVPANVLDVSRIRKDLGWRPEVGLEDGLARTWAWFSGEPKRKN